jgi:hypothetical protein
MPSAGISRVLLDLGLGTAFDSPPGALTFRGEPERHLAALLAWAMPVPHAVTAGAAVVE